MSTAFAVLLFQIAMASGQPAPGPCPVLAYAPNHTPELTRPSPPQPKVQPPFVSELEIQRRCNAWLNSFRPVVDFAPQGQSRTERVSRESAVGPPTVLPGVKPQPPGTFLDQDALAAPILEADEPR